MDPNATLKMIFDDLSEGDYENAVSSCENLHKWVNSGGFPPDGCSMKEINGFIATVMIFVET